MVVHRTWGKNMREKGDKPNGIFRLGQVVPSTGFQNTDPQRVI
jgi:hypothetical protein